MESGNPYYQFYRDINTFTEKLEEERQLHVTLQNEGEEDIVDIGDEESQQNGDLKISRGDTIHLEIRTLSEPIWPFGADQDQILNSGLHLMA